MSTQVFHNIAVIGTSGAIVGALADRLAVVYPKAKLWRFSRQGPERIDYRDESSWERAAALASGEGPLDLVIFAGGILHTSEWGPEKSLRDLRVDKFEALFAANTIAPALAAKHFLPKLARKHRAVFAALSARVGSISDNRLGGWYSYRASKAALNMIIKTAAIEIARKAPEAVVAGLHPGTVDSPLSQPFQANVPEGKLFTPAFCAERLVDVISDLSAADSGGCFAWDGSPISP